MNIIKLEILLAPPISIYMYIYAHASDAYVFAAYTCVCDDLCRSKFGSILRLAYHQVW